ncbi:MAG: aminotransferase class I/II-fold pyridoxal phosphate-dependent enzyme [Clostridiales bacterium]|nr:aminotransferase class I/II-fold pyridoxal phosphate-dependent enzyme [Clostridiales bacterium]
MQAIILAAGMGKRLKELTSCQAKCMVQVNGVSIIERMLAQLDKLSLEKIVIVIGHEGEKLRKLIKTLEISTPIVYVENTIFYKTNNIYSLFLAKDYLLEDDTILLESDLIFEKEILYRILEDPYPNLALVAKFESWMDGTVVTLNEDDKIEMFLTRRDFQFADINNYYKTVNIYKFSKEFSDSHYVPFLEAYCKAMGNNEYYEQVLKVISMLDKQSIKACRLDKGFWYEIDDEQDLDIAESIFTVCEERLSKLNKRYGGYWRYPHLIDFCYLVNPYFPNQKLLDEIKAKFENLVYAYPSGIEVNNLLAAKTIGLPKDFVVVGNGAAELIKVLMNEIEGEIGILYPSFDEYGNCAKEVIPYPIAQLDFFYNAEDIIKYYQKTNIKNLLIINPDNPTGYFLEKEEILKLANWTNEKNIMFILDESFMDFADDYKQHSLLNKEDLEKYQNLIMIKSASKSYGIPGFRLGIMASGNTMLVNKIKTELPIWNINSFAEYFLQIFEKYQSEYKEALEHFYLVRKEFFENLGSIYQLRVFPTQANYIMCEVLDSCTSKKLTEILLNRYDILIKDLSQKKGMEGRQFIRFAIKRSEENQKLVEALKSILK